jgi:NTE family protein
LIVVHLRTGSDWSRHEQTENIIEIRPDVDIDWFQSRRLSSCESLINFDPKRIAELRERGFADAERCLESVERIRTLVRDHRDSVANVRQAITDL